MPVDYPTHRGVVVARRGAVAASQPLAVTAGLRVLEEGGTCVDAAIAVSSVLTVIEPYASHLGGDAFVVLYEGRSGATTAFNGSGAAPGRAVPSAFPSGIPERELRAASVPGLVSCWEALHARLGRLPWARLFERGIEYAADGFLAGYRYCRSLNAHRESGQPWALDACRLLTGLDRPVRPGDPIVQPALARTLRLIAEQGRDAFYDGPITRDLIAFSDGRGGLFSTEDFRNHVTQIGEPIRTTYRGYTVHGQPPVSQGLILLQALNLLEGFDVRGLGFGSADLVHVAVEAKKLAFADRAAYLGDPATVRVPLDELLSKRYADERRRWIDMRHASARCEPGDPLRSTTYFAVADGEGNGISFIQSIFHSLGCGAVDPATGVVFNNRMTGFDLDAASPNCLAPGKRPAHTLNAFVVTDGAKLRWVGGTPGGNVQVQSNLQVLTNVIDFEMNPQAAIEAPRWEHGAAIGTDPVLRLESRFDEEAFVELRRRGHQVERLAPWGHGSTFQLIERDPSTGALHAASDPRGDGHAAGF